MRVPFVKTTIRAALAVIAMESVLSAGPILTMTWAPPADDPRVTTFTLTHGAVNTTVTHTPGSIESPSNFWKLTFVNIQETDNPGAGGVDTVRVLATINHITNPPGHDDGLVGVPFSFDLTVTGNAPNDTASGNRMHGINGHADRFTIALGATTANSQITAYTLTVSGAHVPEPSTFVPVGSGLALALLHFHRKRAQSSIR